MVRDKIRSQEEISPGGSKNPQTSEEQRPGISFSGTT